MRFYGQDYTVPRISDVSGFVEEMKSTDFDSIYDEKLIDLEKKIKKSNFRIVNLVYREEDGKKRQFRAFRAK